MSRKLATLFLFLFLVVAAVLSTSLCLICTPNGLDKLAAYLHGGIYVGDDGIVRQRQSNDCAVACTAMYLAHMKSEYKYEELLKAIPLSKDGASMQNILDAIHKYGVSANYERINKKQIDALPLPAIAFVSGNHFVLIDKVEPHFVILGDPSIGRVAMLRVIFDLTWSGDVVIPHFIPSIQANYRKELHQ